MGRKLKTQDTQPLDVFDNLLIESHQAPTVALMLDSPEDEVVIRAADAQFRFAEKCDKNKLTLLAIDCVLERLLTLINSEELVIRRNCIMALASLSRHADVRKYLRKIPDTVARIVELLKHDNNEVILEYSALCLSSLAVDFTAKNAIYCSGGLVELVKCLSCDDPDVVKNSIETIALTLQEYTAKIGFRDIPDSMSSVTDLLTSEYPVIQHQALVALTSLAEDGNNRCLLCELDVVTWIVTLLTKCESSDLQVFAVMLLDNCLEDEKMLKLFKDAGGLQILIGFITDKNVVQSEEEKAKEEKGKGKKEKAGQDAGRKSRAVDDEEARHKNRTVTDPDVITLPDIKEHVSRALARCVRNQSCQKILHESEVERKLIAILVQDKNIGTQLSAVLVLGVLAQFESSRDVIGKLELAIDAMVKLVAKRDNADALDAVSLALANLTVNNEHNCNEMLKCGALDLLVSLVAEPREMTSSHAATALSNMAVYPQIRAELTRLHAVTALVSALAKTRSALVEARCLWALSSLIIDCEARTQFVDAGGLETLVKLLPSGHNVVVRNTSWLIALLASADQQLAVVLCLLGGLDQLRDIQNSVTRQNALSQIALSKLYNAHLTAKYAYTGQLDAGDIIPDGFYDPGQLKVKGQLRSIEEYGIEELNGQRPVILVNPRPEAAVVSSPSLLGADQSDKMAADKSAAAAQSSTGRSSRTGRDIKIKRSQKDKDKDAEKQREEEQLLQQSLQREADRMASELIKDKLFVMPCDPQLLYYIDDVMDQIKPLPSSMEQAIALARYVSDKMGGPMASCQQPNTWQCEQLKLKEKFKSNVIPLGLITNGFYWHRALLFKVLADRIGLQTSLIRADYGRAWNQILLSSANVSQCPGECQLPKSYIIDVMHDPGSLLDLCGYDALAYMTSQMWQN